MAKVAKRFIVWQSTPKIGEDGYPLMKRMLGLELDEPDTERIEIALDAVVPDTVPEEVVKEWEEHDMVFEDPKRERISHQGGPPRMLLPAMAAQRAEHAKKATAIPPRISHK